MNFLTDIGLGLVLIEGTVLISLVIIILIIKRTLRSTSSKRGRVASKEKKSLYAKIDKLSDLLKESESLSQDLSKNLTEKREIVQTLLSTLDEKILTLEQVLEKIERREPVLNSGANGQEGGGEVLELAQAGCAVPDIAKRLGLSKEEVQLILDLRKITAI
jgi:predicted transcriptional regulator